MSLVLKPRQIIEDEMENWDDDDDIRIEASDFAFRTASATTTATSQHRGSVSSRMSIQSDFDSNIDDDERELHLPEDHERVPADAIAQAAKAGIPLPENIPPSALMGGTIKRLGGRKIHRAIKSDDWDDDLELPAFGNALEIKNRDAYSFPDALRQVSGPAPVFDLNNTLKPKAFQSLNLQQFKDDDDDFLGDGETTIKVVKRAVKSAAPTSFEESAEDIDNFESEYVMSTQPLQLSSQRDIPQTPSRINEDHDWAEAGSLGIRHGGQRRDGRSNRSSSASALSPSVSSSFTLESEDEGLDGLVLPVGPLKFDEILKKRKDGQEVLATKKSQVQQQPVVHDNDFMSGLEFEDDVFDTRKLTLNRNIRVKNNRQISPQRPKTAVSLTFTNRPVPPITTRIPRPSTADRLNPVSEDGGPIMTKIRRSQSRLGGHLSHSSLSQVSVPLTPSSARAQQPSTPRRTDFAMGHVNQRSLATTTRHDNVTTNAQLLRLKRSMPSLRPGQSPARPLTSRYDRPPSRTDLSRPSAMSRPKTPVDNVRSGTESSLGQSRKNPLPFLPAGSSHAVSHHVITKSTSSMHIRQNDFPSSCGSGDGRPSSRAASRSTMRSPSPAKTRARGAELLAREVASKRQITRPVKRRHFGDGFELDGFDDLPTSHNVEAKYTKQPVSRGPPKALVKNKAYQNSNLDRTSTPTPFSPARQDNLPRFARDTNASRMAREQVLSQRAPSSAPLQAITNQWKAQVNARTGLSTHNNTTSSRNKAKKPVQQKPHLIKPMGDVSKTTKSVKGMLYNPTTMRWEGNENDLASFDIPVSSPTMPPPLYQEKQLSTPRPALITQINASQGVQVVGGMVFDPVKMCWLKMPSAHKSRIESRPGTGRSDVTLGRDTMDGFDALDDEEEDVFKDVPDLEDKITRSPSKGDVRGRKSLDNGLKDEWLVGEEFDVGPEFIRRQREEEERWTRKCEKWLGDQRDDIEMTEDWRWRIRDVVSLILY